MAAPSLVQVGHAGGGAPVTTASLTWQASDVLVVIAGNEGATNGDTLTLSNTGSGLAFGAALQSHAASSSCAGLAWGCVASSGSSGTFTATKSPAGASQTDICVYIFRGSAGLGGSALALTRTVALTPAASSAVVWGVWDFAAVATQGNTPTATSHNASTPGPSATPTDTAVGTNYTYYENEIDDGTGVTSYGIGGSTGGPFVTIAVEVKASAGATFIARPATVAGQGSTPSAITGVAGSTVVTQGVRQAVFY